MSALTSMAGLMRHGSLLLVAGVVLSACAQAPLNTKLSAYDPGGYRYANVAPSGDGELLVLLAFSGGGTRAAAFSFGVLEALRAVEYQTKEGPRRLLDRVEMISAISGGSFTAAYYALFGERAFETFPEAFLHRNIEGGLKLRALSPYNWARLVSPGFSRIDLAAEFYDQEVFEGKTFASLLSNRRAPYIMINASDMTTGEQFTFTQDEFDFLCSDLSSMAIARAVAASSAYPVLLSPLTVKNYSVGDCQPFVPPPWFQTALITKASETSSPPDNVLRARRLYSYLDKTRPRNFVHLLDGGIVDNLGLQALHRLFTSFDGSDSILWKINRASVRRIIVIAVNAKAEHRHDWDTTQTPPGALDVLNFVTSKPIDTVSVQMVNRMRTALGELHRDETNYRACETVLRSLCPDARLPFALPELPDLIFLEVSFGPSLGERVQRCLQELPTAFHLPEAQVTLLRQAAGAMLYRSPEFIRTMRLIAPEWHPPTAAIDEGLIQRACHS